MKQHIVNRICLAVAMTAIAVVLLPLASASKADPPGFAKSIMAETFTVVDGDGKGRIELSAANGIPALRISDKQGHTRLVCSVGPDGSPVVLMMSPKGKPRLSISCIAERGPAYQLYAPEGKGPALTMNYLDKGKGAGLVALHLYTPKDAKARASFGILPDADSAMLVFYDKAGKPAWAAP